MTTPRPLLFPKGFVHLHPTQACNLECLHCYSSSSPSRRAELQIEQCLTALSSLAQRGFTHLNLSGGEPTLYSGFDQIIDLAIELGMHVSVITNGWRSTPRVLNQLARCDTIAVSVDGPKGIHDHIRRREGSYDAALRTVRALVAKGCNVGIVSCVTESTIDFVPQLWEIAASLDVALFQVRPIARVGRAVKHRHLETPLPDRLAVVATTLASIEDGPRVQCDLIGTQHLSRAIEELIARVPYGGLAELATPLVVDERGLLRPYSYNLMHNDLGHISGLSADSFLQSFELWRTSALELHRRTARLASTSGSHFVDWFELLVQASLERPERSVSVRTRRR